jgi:hypothetical protein
MIGLLCFALAVLASPFKSKFRLQAENAVLRHQLIVLRRRLRGRVRLTNNDRWFFIQLYRWCMWASRNTGHEASGSRFGARRAALVPNRDQPQRYSCPSASCESAGLGRWAAFRQGTSIDTRAR